MRNTYKASIILLKSNIIFLHVKTPWSFATNGRAKLVVHFVNSDWYLGIPQLGKNKLMLEAVGGNERTSTPVFCLLRDVV